MKLPIDPRTIELPDDRVVAILRGTYARGMPIGATSKSLRKLRGG